MQRISLLLLLFLCSSTWLFGVEANQNVNGVVLAGGTAVQGAQVNVYLAGGQSAILLSQNFVQTDSKGRFSVQLCDIGPSNSVLYVVAELNGHAVKYLTAFDPRSTLDVTVNEVTTVGTVFALNQFISSSGSIHGPSLSLYNALLNAYNLYDPSTGDVGHVIASSPNGVDSEALPTLNSLANVLLACSADSRVCSQLFAAVQVDSTLPVDTVAALRSVARNPANNILTIFLLTQQQSFYSPALEQAPNGWYLALLFTDGGFDAPGRMAFDSSGRQWVISNFQPPTTSSSRQTTVLDPSGQPILNSPIQGGGIDGTGYGVVLDLNGNVWFGNFGGNTISEFNSKGQPLSPDPAWDNGDICRPQGMAIDFDNNLWIASNDGGGQTDACPEGKGSAVTVYPNCNRHAAVTATTDILYPFDVAIDNQGRAWVTNGGPHGDSVVVLKFDKDTQTISTVMKINNTNSGQGGSGFSHPLFAAPHTVALDSRGNAWVANSELNSVTFIDMSHPSNPVVTPIVVPLMLGPWGLAVDSGDRVWVADFVGKTVFLLCGTNPDSCPAGSQAVGDSLSPHGGFAPSVLQHLTGIQVDEAGNVWAANNITPNSTLMDYTGGNGVVQFVGLGYPVRVPLLGQPVRPKSSQDPSLSSKCQQSSQNQESSSSPASRSAAICWGLWLAVVGSAAMLAGLF